MIDEGEDAGFRHVELEHCARAGRHAERLDAPDPAASIGRAIEHAADDVRRGGARTQVDEVDPHEASRVQAHGLVVEAAVEHREELVVLGGPGGIGARDAAGGVAGAEDRVLHDHDLARRPEALVSRVDDQRAVPAALDVEVGHRSGRPVTPALADAQYQANSGRRRPSIATTI